MKKCVYSLMALALILVCCCKTSKKNVKSDNLPLIGTQWNLVALDGKEITKEFALRPFITFDSAGAIQGNLGCNSFFGTYEINKKHKMTLEYQGSTKRLCNKMDAEKQFISALKQDVNLFQIRGNELILSAGEKEVMRFEGVDLSKVE